MQCDLNINRLPWSDLYLDSFNSVRKIWHGSVYNNCKITFFKAFWHVIVYEQKECGKVSSGFSISFISAQFIYQDMTNVSKLILISGYVFLVYISNNDHMIWRVKNCMINNKSELISVQIMIMFKCIIPHSMHNTVMCLILRYFKLALSEQKTALVLV
jgi:hypothetical protein